MTAVPSFYLMGIGGTGMSALAHLLLQQGCRVSGSDGALYPPVSLILKGLNLKVWEGYDPEHLPKDQTVVVVGNTIKRGNPELEAWLATGGSYTSMANALFDQCLKNRQRIVVAGTHGKTTTTAMISHLFRHAGRDCGCFIGGLPLAPLPQADLGSDPLFVLEGDEYGSCFHEPFPKLWWYRPHVLVLNGIERDHLDFFPTMEHYLDAFKRSVQQLPPNGHLFFNGDCPHSSALAINAPCPATSVGWSPTCAWQLLHWEPQGLSSILTMKHASTTFTLLSQTLGAHNAMNAAMSFAVGQYLGLSIEDCDAGLASFPGVARRFQLLTQKENQLIIEDFAHHPGAIASSIEATRTAFPHHHLEVWLEPSTGSMRRGFFQDALAQVLALADQVRLAPIVQAQLIPKAQRLDVQALCDALQAQGTSSALNSFDQFQELIRQTPAKATVVLILTSAGFGGLLGQLRQNQKDNPLT
jgi:UDP-N-acetylmuramate: L-alanyl-gamma-D-glutamyl-meso-diaminopimelate ligase